MRRSAKEKRQNTHRTNAERNTIIWPSDKRRENNDEPERRKNTDTSRTNKHQTQPDPSRSIHKTEKLNGRMHSKIKCVCVFFCLCVCVCGMPFVWHTLYGTFYNIVSKCRAHSISMRSKFSIILFLFKSCYVQHFLFTHCGALFRLLDLCRLCD